MPKKDWRNAERRERVRAKKRVIFIKKWLGERTTRGVKCLVCRTTTDCNVGLEKRTRFR